MMDRSHNCPASRRRRDGCKDCRVLRERKNEEEAFAPEESPFAKMNCLGNVASCPQLLPSPPPGGAAIKKSQLSPQK